MNYFIGDLHFGHVNCLSFDKRPFKTIEDHDAVLIKNWNNVVGMKDDVYILGDISWYNTTKTLEILKQLNGHIHLIRGNHDHKHLKNRELQSMFVEITDYKELHIPGTDGKKNSNGVVLCHYPIPCFNHHYYGWHHLYAHVHNSFEWNMMERIKYEMKELYNRPCNMYNAGAMMPYMNYTPRTLEEIITGADRLTDKEIEAAKRCDIKN